MLRRYRASHLSPEMKPKYELDPDTIECPVCKEVLCPPVHQCRNGHIACSACNEKLKEKECPSCRSKPFAHARCLAVEKIIESLLISCRHASHGCTEMVKIARKEEHERALCRFRPIQCPVPNCKHKCLNLDILEHFGNHVRPDQIVQLDPLTRIVEFRMDGSYVVVQSDDGLFLVHHLKRCTVPGDVFFCTSFGSISKTYKLKVMLSGESSCFSMQTSASNNQESEETWLKNDFIRVSNVNRSQNQQFNLKLRLLQ